jgi:hypothetical protein
MRKGEERRKKRGRVEGNDRLPSWEYFSFSRIREGEKGRGGGGGENSFRAA